MLEGMKSLDKKGIGVMFKEEFIEAYVQVRKGDYNI